MKCFRSSPDWCSNIHVMRPSLIHHHLLKHSWLLRVLSCSGITKITSSFSSLIDLTRSARTRLIYSSIRDLCHWATIPRTVADRVGLPFLDCCEWKANICYIRSNTTLFIDVISNWTHPQTSNRELFMLLFIITVAFCQVLYLSSGLTLLSGTVSKVVQRPCVRWLSALFIRPLPPIVRVVANYGAADMDVACAPVGI